jgi:hypothetical protein
VLLVPPYEEEDCLSGQWLRLIRFLIATELAAYPMGG